MTSVQIKPNFGTSNELDKKYYVPGKSLAPHAEFTKLTSQVLPSIKDDPESGVENGRLLITSIELKEVFDDVIRAILDLIIVQVEQVEAAPGNHEVSAILLVGGFGSSQYLLKSIEEHFRDLLDVTVIQPVGA
jgi:hypothetical protein